mgnify:CR=1 FL=1
MGNDRTGYNVPFVFAFATIAASIVDDVAKQSVPRKIVREKMPKFLTIKSSTNKR